MKIPLTNDHQYYDYFVCLSVGNSFATYEGTRPCFSLFDILKMYICRHGVKVRQNSLQFKCKIRASLSISLNLVLI